MGTKKRGLNSEESLVDVVGEAVAVYDAGAPRVASGRVMLDRPGKAKTPPLPPELQLILDAQNQPASRMAARRAFNYSPAELGRAAVAFAAKKR